MLLISLKEYFTNKTRATIHKLMFFNGHKCGIITADNIPPNSIKCFCGAQKKLVFSLMVGAACTAG